MEARTQQIRAAAKKLLSEGQVDYVLGYAKGTIPMRDYPFFAYTPEECDQLIWSSFCCNNLANFVIRHPGKPGVVAQGCVSRNLVVLVQENQIKQDELKVIGVPCLGMVDRRKIQDKLAGKVILEVAEAGEQLVVKGKGFEDKLARKELLRDNCYTCLHRNPVMADVLVADKVEETGGGDIEAVAAPWAGLSPEERWHKFGEEILDECIRCYACRDACPLCYCHVCFVDESMPQWCAKTQDEADVATFHLLRAFHCAGRCTDCGACESACPQGLKMRRLTSKIEKDIRGLYGFQPGLDVKATPPMSVYRPNDPQEFIK